MNKISLTDKEKRCLFQKALDMRKLSYAPYSHFLVGAALYTNKKNIYTGCNIENAAFTPTNCAERTAVFKAVSEGEKEFLAIAIAGGKEGEKIQFCPPCGVCRQVLREFCRPDEFLIYLVKEDLSYEEYTLEALLPMGFGL